MSEISKITQDPNIIKVLEAKSITSLEQIALSSPELLGLATNKAQQVINAAMGVLTEDNIEDIRISTLEVTVSTKNLNKAIFDSICHTLGVTPNVDCFVKRTQNIITFSLKEGKKACFKEIIKNASKLRNHINARKNAVMLREGVTLPAKEIIEFAKEKKFEGFYQEFFSDVVGNELMKKVLTASLFSTFDNPVHVLILGDPGSAKTLAHDILIKNLSNITPIGANATKAGLVCNMSTGDLGALAVSDRKVVIIDEFDKINTTDLEFCYELMSNGRCSVHSARVHKDIVSNFILIGFGNPKSEVFNPLAPMNDIGMERTLLSRFAFVIKTDSLTREEKKDLFKNRFLGKSKVSENLQLFDQWIKFSRTYQPKLIASEEKIDGLIKRAVEIVETHAVTPLRRDLRMGDYLRRIAMSLARLEFADIDDRIIERAYNLIKESIDIWNFNGVNLGFFGDKED